MDVTVGCKLPNGIIIEQGGKTISLNGANSARIAGGHGLTVVDGNLFTAWMEAHKDFAPVKKGLIFAHESPKRVEEMAAEREENKTGMEPIDPEKPGGGVEPTDEMKKTIRKKKADK